MAKYGPTDLEVKSSEPGYADYLQFLLFGEAGIAAYGNPLVGTRFMAPDDQKTNWTASYLKGAILKRLQFVADKLEGRPYVAANRFTAADISVGLPALERWIPDPNPDVRWIVRQNLAKARLARAAPGWVERARAAVA